MYLYLCKVIHAVLSNSRNKLGPLFLKCLFVTHVSLSLTASSCLLLIASQKKLMGEDLDFQEVRFLFQLLNRGIKFMGFV